MESGLELGQFLDGGVSMPCAVRFTICILMAFLMSVTARAESEQSLGVSGASLPWEVVLLLGLLGGLLIAFSILAWHQLRSVAVDDEFDVPLQALNETDTPTGAAGLAGATSGSRARSTRSPVNGARLSFGKRS
jgi:uncharacterized integral membrane protein